MLSKKDKELIVAATKAISKRYRNDWQEVGAAMRTRDGRIITVPLVWYPRLLNATSAQRQNWKIAGGGYGLHWPDLDEDLSTEGLLRGAPAPRVSVPNSHV